MKDLHYQETLLYGHHSRKSLGQAVQKETQRRQRRLWLQEQLVERTAIVKCYQNCRDKWKVVSETKYGRLLEDFIFLSTLGISVAAFSFLIDLIVNQCSESRIWINDRLSFNVLLQFIAWMTFFLVFTWFSVGVTHIIAPTAIGSGIPEMKTMIRGVLMEEYLTLRALIAKVVGLSASLGSGLPVGKEGPFVHIAGIAAAVTAKCLPSFQSAADNIGAHMADILAPACAVGVACTFAAPVGGLLYSIEATATTFAVRNYWRGFYAAAIGTITFRLFAIWFHAEETLTALERTHLPQEVPFHPMEMLVFTLLGALCGVGGALFIIIHKNTVMFVRHQKFVNKFLQKNRFIYPTIVTILIGGLLFPGGLGQYMAGELTNPEALKELFSNMTWAIHQPETLEEARLLHHWQGPLNNVFLSTGLFFSMRLWMCAVSTTFPLPSGIIVPAFTLGAGFGRLFGETVAYIYPKGIGGNLIVPGAYALVGSAAFGGSVTHTFSTVVIVFELTGQIGHILPCCIAVIISNVVSRLITPSVYECIIHIKELPYLPSAINADATDALRVVAEDIMLKDVKYLHQNSTYLEAQNLLDTYSYTEFPLVSCKDKMLLLGVINRMELERVISLHLTLQNKLVYFTRKMHDVIKSGRHTTENRSNNETRKPSRFVVTKLQDEDDRKSSAVSRSSISNNTESSRWKPSFSKSTKEQDKRDHVRFKESTSLELHDPEQEKEWEEYELDRAINYDDVIYDAAPFQISQKMSLLKIHNLFSLLTLQKALVTQEGRLTGLITVDEVRMAVDPDRGLKDRGIFHKLNCCSSDNSSATTQTAPVTTSFLIVDNYYVFMSKY